MTDDQYNILMIVPSSFFGDYGGHIRIFEETVALQAQGHRVTLVTYYKGRDLPELQIERTAALPWRTEYEVGSSRHKIAFDIYLAWKTWQVTQRLKPDLIHGHMHEGALIGAAVAWLYQLPLVFDFQGSLTGEMVDHGFLRRGSFIYRTVRRLEEWICRMPQKTLTSSVRAGRMLEAEFAVPQTKIQPLPDCVDLERFNPGRFTEAGRQRLRAEWGIPSDRPVVVYLGLLAEYQGTAHLLQAAAQLQQAGEDVHFLIMGYPSVDHYRNLARQMGVAERVTFTGRVPYDKAPYFLSIGDIAISAKMSSSEGSGKVLNYMAMKQPVVAYDTEVHREYLADAGVYAPVGDVDGLTAAIQSLLHNPLRRQQLGQQLYERVQAKYNWRHAGELIREVYAELLAENRG